MATVSPVISPVNKVPRVIWETLATGDTINSFTITEQWGLAGSVQIAGTFGGATVKLQQSNDGVNWADIKDIYGSTVSATAAAVFEITSSAVYFRPAISGGTGDDVDLVVVFRGLY